MSAPLRVLRLKTPAAIFSLTEAETEAFGRVQSLVPAGRIWGEFAPDTPRSVASGEGETYLIQTARFTCRHDQGLGHGATLRIEGADWRVQSLYRDADGYVCLGLERVLA